MRKVALGFWIITVLVISSNGLAFGNGFKILGVKSTKATAMGEAFIAQADNPSAIAFNPAGLTQVKGTQISTEGIITNAWLEHTSPAGKKEDIQDKWQIVPSFFITSDLGIENITAGIGVTVPNGLSSKWSESSFARYVATYTDLKLIDINPSLALKINDNLSIGGGISYYYSSSVSEVMADYGTLIGLPGQFDGKVRMKGDGDAWGYNAGILFKLNDSNSIAATFKSPYKITYKGNARYEGIPLILGLGATIESDAVSSIKFPAIVVLGYAFRPIDRLKLEFNLDWTNWETLDSVSIDFTNPSLTDVTYDYDYMNTFAYKFGAEYSITEWLQLRAGYIYNENAVPEANWRPSLPDTNSHFLCSGFGYQIGEFTIDGAIQIILYEDRTINNNVDNNEVTTSSSIDGKYENFALGFSLGVTYKF